MTRRLFTLAALLSLALCLATAVLWVRSYWVSDAISHANSSSLWSVESSLGRLQCWHMRSPGSRFEVSGWWRTSGPPKDLHTSQNIFPAVKSFCGFAYASDRDDFVASTLWVVPTPALLLLFLVGALPALGWLRCRVFRSPSTDRGYCGNCGYDLRASLGRCSECGTTTPEANP